MTFRAATLAMIVLLMWVAGGCSAGAAAAKGGPRDRIGALPFPGAFTLYRPANPDDLGEHRYELSPRWFHRDESSGILYTTRAGFLDLAHVRITVDTVRFCTRQVRAAIAARRDVVTLPTIEGSTFIVTLHDPADLRDDDVADELAIRTGQRLGYLMMTWHEMITWFGYRTILFIDESPSAFTYDDTMSHVVGLRVAGRALRDRSGRSFDESATVALREELADLGAVSPSETERAARAVEGLWWSHGKPLKRHLEIGLGDDTVRAWLIPTLQPMHDAQAQPFRLPSLGDIAGHDYRGFYSVQIDPGIRMSQRMRRELPTHPALIDVDRDYPVLLEIVRNQMQHRLSPDVDQPWPALVARTQTPPATRPRFEIDSAQPITAAAPRPNLHRRTNGVAVSGSAVPPP